MSLDQQRAKYSWTCVQGCNSDYVNLAKSVPALIMNSGLMQTLAFLQAKGKPHHRALIQHLCEWLRRRYEGRLTAGDFATVMAQLHADEDRAFYREATEETLALLRWIRQFAAAVHVTGGGNG